MNPQEFYYSVEPKYTIEFKNGSKIETFTSTENPIRGHRSRLIGFYCVSCDVVHVDVPINELVIIADNMMMCKKSYDDAINLYLNDWEVDM